MFLHWLQLTYKIISVHLTVYPYSRGRNSNHFIGIKDTAINADWPAPMAVYHLLSFAFILVLFHFLHRKRPLRFLPLQLRQLGLHLHDQGLELLLALLAGVGIDIAGVLFTIGPLGGVAALEEMVADLADAAGAGAALAAHIGLEVGHSRLFRLGWGSFLSRL